MIWRVQPYSNFASPGYGKSTILQTIAINLAHKNTPEQVHFNLLDFGNNGASVERFAPCGRHCDVRRRRKIAKMLDRVSQLLAQKRLFKETGVASLIQYEAKTQKNYQLLLIC